VGLRVTVLTQLHKGLKAGRLAERAGLHDTSIAWGWQTLLLGFPSMNLLLPRIERATRERANANWQPVEEPPSREYPSAKSLVSSSVGQLMARQGS